MRHCLTDDLVAVMVEGRLPCEELHEALQHLGECGVCEQLVGEVLRSWERAPEPARSAN
jgi:hypothetical protein